MDIFAEIPAKMRKLSAALDSIRSRTKEMHEQGQFVYAMEEMIDERFSLFMNYVNGQLMLVDKINGNFDVKSMYNVITGNDTIGINLSSDYITYSTFS